MPVASFTDAWIETQRSKARIMQARSHLLQMRGLKHRDAAVFKLQQESHLLQMRGLKHLCLDREHHRHEVASFTDAWIETRLRKYESSISIVASFTDAWIETRM